jgi:hypothetical protein
VSKNCAGCLFFTECWEDGSDYCYRDKELILKPGGAELSTKSQALANLSYTQGVMIV